MVEDRVSGDGRRAPAKDILCAVDSSRGLPSNQVHKIARDRLSRLWLATPTGLACFDGRTVRSYDRRDGLRCAGLRSVAVDADGTIWVGTDLGLEALDGSLRPMPWMEWFAWGYGLCEHIDASGSQVWIGSARGVVRLSRGEGSAPPKIDLYVDVGFVRHLAVDREGHAYVASATQGLLEVDGTSVRRVRIPQLLDRRISRLAKGPSEDLFVGTDKGLVAVHTGSGRFREMGWPPSGEREVSALAAGPRELWVAFGRTLVAVPLDRSVADASEVHQADSRINDVRADDLGNVWIATDNSGLAYLSCLRHCIRRIDLGKDGAVYSIRRRRENLYDIGGENILCTLERTADGETSVAPGPAGLPDTTVWDTHCDSSKFCVATHAGLYHASHGKDLERAFSDVGVLSGPARVLCPRGEDIFVGTLRGLAKIRNGKAEEVRPLDGEPLGYIYALVLDDASRLWVATLGRGLWRENEKGRLDQICGGPLTPVGNTYAVAQGPGGDVAVLQDEKVVLLDREGAPRLLQESHPVAGWACTWLDDRTLAIGASDGLRLLDAVSGEVKMTIRSLLGAREWEFTNNRALLHDGHRRVLCGINGGLVEVDLNELDRFLTPPPIAVADILWENVQPVREGRKFRLSPGRWTLRVRAFSPWFVDHRTLRYQFKLVGFDEAWSSLRLHPDFVCNSLPPGEYQLLGRTFSPLVGFGPPEVLAEVSVAHSRWTKGWLVLVQTVEGLLDNVIRFHSHNRKLLRQNLFLEQEVMERTRALRAANEELQKLSSELEQLSLIDPLTKLSNRRHFEAEFARELERSRRQHAPLSLLMLDVDYFKTVNDTMGHPKGDEYLQAIAQGLRREVRGEIDTCARLGGEEFVVLMPATGREEGLAAAERLRRAVEGLDLVNEASPFGRVTLSGGIATLDPRAPASGEELLRRADHALYQAKHEGRNRIVAWQKDG